MAAKNNFLITIYGDDKLSPAIKKIGANVTEMNRPFDAAGKLIDNLSKGSGLQKFSEGLSTTAAAASDIASSLEKIMPPLGALVSAGSIAGLASLSEKWAAQARHIQLVSSYTDIATDSLLRYSNAAEAAGLDGSGMVDKIAAFQQKLEAGEFGRDNNAVAVLTDMHLGVGDPADVTIQKIAAWYARKAPKQGQAGLGALGLGDLSPLISQFDKYMGAGDKFGFHGSAQDFINGGNFKDSLNQSLVAIHGLEAAIGAGLDPQLQKTVDHMNEWIVANQRFIASDITGFVGRLWRDLSAVSGGIESIGEKIGLWKDGADALCKVLEIAVVAALSKVSYAILAANTAFIRTPLGAFIGGSMAGYAVIDSLGGQQKDLLAAPMNWAIGGLYGTIDNFTGNKYDLKNKYAPGYGDAFSGGMGLSDYWDNLGHGGLSMLSGDNDDDLYKRMRRPFAAEQTYGPFEGPPAEDSKMTHLRITLEGAPHGTRYNVLQQGDVIPDVNIMHSSTGSGY